MLSDMLLFLHASPTRALLLVQYQLPLPCCELCCCCQGYSLLLKPEKLIDVDKRTITVKGGETFGCIEIEVTTVQCQLLFGCVRVHATDTCTTNR